MSRCDLCGADHGMYPDEVTAVRNCRDSLARQLAEARAELWDMLQQADKYNLPAARVQRLRAALADIAALVDAKRLEGQLAEARARIAEVGVDRERVMAAELLRAGGAWLGAARNWIQWHRHNGDTVTWGSTDELRPPMTVRDVEELASEVAAAAMATQPTEKRVESCLRARWDAERKLARLETQLAGARAPIAEVRQHVLDALSNLRELRSGTEYPNTCLASAISLLADVRDALADIDAEGKG